MAVKKGYRLAIKTIGCRLNQAESQDLAAQLDQAGFRIVSEKSAADILVVNSCAVTLAATRKSRQVLRAYRHRWPRTAVVVLGCSEPELRALPELSLAINRIDKNRAAEIIKKHFRFPEKQKRKIQAKLLNRRTRALLKIQDGCDEFCTYCIVPFRRGKPHSVPLSKVLANIRKWDAVGVKEIVLTGVHIGGYRSRGVDFAGLVRKILEQSGIPRIRFSSLEPQHLTPEIVALFRSPRVCPFLHLPIQSGQDEILAAMHRRYSVARLISLVRSVRKVVPKIFLSTDVIVGFPGETEAHFRRTVALCRRLHFAKIHVFSYSIREGTRASLYPNQLGPETIARRSRLLRRVSDRLNLEYRQRQVGKQAAVLLETPRAGISRDGLKISLDPGGKTNTEVIAQITAVTANQTLAKLIRH